VIERLLETHWGLHPPLQLEPLSTGFNNASWFVTSGDGEYVLKRSLNIDAGSRVGFEHALLRALAQANLPFAVPAPVPTKTGEMRADVPEGGAFSLTHRIPGKPGWRGDPTLARRAGHALAILDRALASVELPTGPQVPEAYPSLDVSDARIARGLDVDRVLAREIGEILGRAERQLASTTTGWPTQVIHTDFFPTNVLVDHGTVAGVIDFEFAGSGHLAMDFAIGLVAFGTNRGEFVPHVDLMEAFAAGYLGTASLSPGELAAIPHLILMREAGSFAHWFGRMESGLATRDDLRERGQRLLDLDRWLSANRDDLVAQLGRVIRS